MSTRNQTLGGFEERLLTQLKDVVTERAATVTAPVPQPDRRPQRSPQRRLVFAFGAAAVLALVGVVAGPALVGNRHAAAYAVERDPDGSIRIYIREYKDPKGLQRAIEAEGVKAAVDYIPNGMTCKEPRGDMVPDDEVPLGLITLGPPNDTFDGYYWKLHPEKIKPDQTFVYVVQVFEGDDGSISKDAHVQLANGPVAPCVPVPGGTKLGSGG